MADIDAVEQRLVALDAFVRAHRTLPDTVDALLDAWAVAGELHARSARAPVGRLPAHLRALLVEAAGIRRQRAVGDWCAAVAAAGRELTDLASVESAGLTATMACALLNGLDARESWHRASTVVALLDAVECISGPPDLMAADIAFDALAAWTHSLAAACAARLAELPNDVADAHWWYWMPIHAADRQTNATRGV